jgi:uncharacterized protein (DUF1330 family)
MSAYVIFDVEIRDMARYQDFMKGVKPALDAAGAKYLARGGAHKVYEGDWEPRRIVLLEFPSVAARSRPRGWSASRASRSEAGFAFMAANMRSLGGRSTCRVTPRRRSSLRSEARGASFPSPRWGEGDRERSKRSGEGLMIQIRKQSPLTPTLSPLGRGRRFGAFAPSR